MKIKEVREWMNRNEARMVQTLGELISIPTENPPGKSYEACVAAIGRFLEAANLAFDIVNAGDEEGLPRPSIIGSTESGDPALHFHGHYDVVAAQSTAQFEARRLDGRIIGRGSSDMKGGLAAMLYALACVGDMGAGAGRGVSFSIAPDEETGGKLGTRYLFEKNLLPKPAQGMLMPEPTSGAVWSASKGALSLRVTVKGKAAHVGLASLGVNAFERMVGVAQSVLSLKPSIEKRETTLAVSPPEARRSVIVVGGRSGSGENFNSVPERAFFTVDRRLNPEEDLAAAKREMFAVLEEEKRKGIDLEVQILQEGESSRAGETTTLAETLARSVGEVTGTAPGFELCPGLLETRYFIRQGIPAYAYGPGILEVSHKADEYVRIADVLNCAMVYALTAARLLGKSGDGARSRV